MSGMSKLAGAWRRYTGMGRWVLGHDVGVAGGQGAFGIIDGIWLHLIVAQMDALPGTIVVRADFTAAFADAIAAFTPFPPVTGITPRKTQLCGPLPAPRFMEWGNQS